MSQMPRSKSHLFSQQKFIPSFNKNYSVLIISRSHLLTNSIQSLTLSPENSKQNPKTNGMTAAPKNLHAYAKAERMTTPHSPTLSSSNTPTNCHLVKKLHTSVSVPTIIPKKPIPIASASRLVAILLNTTATPTRPLPISPRPNYSSIVFSPHPMPLCSASTSPISTSSLPLIIPQNMNTCGSLPGLYLPT